MSRRVVNISLVRPYFLILIFFGLNIPFGMAQITYKIQTKLFDYRVLDSYPQKVISMESKDGIYHITLQVFTLNYDTIKTEPILPNQQYPSDVSPFLEPTPLINHLLPGIKYISDTLFQDEEDTWGIIQKGLKFTTDYMISFDDSLAKEIDKGACSTLDISTILQRKKGTCSEYTNLFIALMRSKGIPCRFITGYVFYPPQDISGTHAWAECYIKNSGWLPVDPQSGQGAYPIQIKLFAGKDYKDCKIKLLKDIVPLAIEISEN